MAGQLRLWLALLLVALAASACSLGHSPSMPDGSAWAQHASSALEDAASQVATMQLVLEVAADGHAFGEFQQTVAVDSETKAGETASGFTSLQPPAGVDDADAAVSALLADATELLTQTRIAIVRRESRAYPELRQELEELARAFAEMSGRVAAVSGRATFDLIRERLGPRGGLANLVASMFITFLTFVAEIGGVALALQLVASVNTLLVIPLVGLVVWLVLWRAKFSAIENVVGLLGLSLIVFAVAVWQLGPDWGSLVHQAVSADKPGDEQWRTYAYYAIALFGAAMTPYEVFFFSSGGVEDRWGPKDIGIMRANVLIGFPLGGCCRWRSLPPPGWCSVRWRSPQTASATSPSRSRPPSARSAWRSRSSASSPRPSAPPARPA